MKRYGWGELPEPVRRAIQEHAGVVDRVGEIGVGQSSNFAAVVHRDEGTPLFVKGVEGVSPAMRWLRNEAELGTLAAGIAPAVHFAADIDDWLVVGFEYVPGRRASLRPGSPDLRRVADTLDSIGEIAAPGLKPLEQRWKSAWWPRLARERPEIVGAWDIDELTAWEKKAPALTAGVSLLHTDLHADQFLISGNGDVRVVDWGWPAQGAAWVDPAFMVLRLISAGHRVADAEAWASANTRWQEAAEEEVTAFAVYVAGLWNYKAATTTRLARIARDYVGWRLRLPSARAGLAAPSPPPPVTPPP
ncbi:hypothetical protein SAMN04489729_8460 [Amycolatopsis lurida]|uniref:Aminoglycoside phosphotransferase domain-containing protein n=2 Tax=Amycolatopsis lurida TaxID=31959 RepID=A0A2P2FG50_AMYLU|nr:hypothetical protein BB31_40185 [Amycolatopsis lurida NRRL 2430]SEE63438.1 hypothetical protein SAMN04489729_8460 [Amycolatopsis lurida]